MGTNKYGLDFVVWGAVNKPVKSSPTPSEKNRTEKKKEQEHVEDFHDEKEIVQHSVILCNPKFLPDHLTAINKKFTLSVDIKTSQKQGIIAIQLFGIYKGNHFPLGQKDVRFESNNLITSICLECVSDYADDVNKVTADPTLHVDYYFKAESRNAKSVTSSILRLPYLDTKNEQLQKCAARMASSTRAGCNSTVITDNKCSRHQPDEHQVNSDEKKTQLYNSTTVAKAASSRASAIKMSEPWITENKKCDSDCRCIRNTTKDNAAPVTANDKKTQKKNASSVTKAAAKKSPVVSMTSGNKPLCEKRM
ncbi:MAG TPA: hypothetical protein VHO70_11730 [Chitinispirillaceae bacterium]|nr:hypothetical protein [Chitinispirillaceae bacterium]